MGTLTNFDVGSKNTNVGVHQLNRSDGKSAEKSISATYVLLRRKVSGHQSVFA